MKYCNNCGKQLSDEAKFCDNCGMSMANDFANYNQQFNQNANENNYNNVDPNAQYIEQNTGFDNQSNAFQQADNNVNYYDAAPTKQPKKKKTTLVVIIVAVIAVLLIVAKVLGGGEDNSAQDTYTSDVEAPQEQVAQSTNSVTSSVEPPVTLDDDIFSYTFELDGHIYKFPCELKEFKDNGWAFSKEEYNDDILISGSSYDSYFMKNGKKEIMLYSYNLSGNAKKLGECMIGGIYCTNSSLTDIKLAKGITLKSTAEDVKAAYGDANDENIGKDYVSLKYKEDESFYKEVEFYIDEAGKYNSVTIMNFLKTDKDKTETSNEVPAYLSEYIAPKELGKDFKASVFKLDGVVYQLPCPVSEFTKNGWKIISKPNAVVSNGTETITLGKGEVKLSVYLMNLSKYQVKPENTAVYFVEARDYYKSNITIPSKTTNAFVGMSETELKKILGEEFEFYDGDSFHLYSYKEDENRDYEIKYSVDVEKGVITDISIENRTWNYKK